MMMSDGAAIKKTDHTFTTMRTVNQLSTKRTSNLSDKLLSEMSRQPDTIEFFEDPDLFAGFIQEVLDPETLTLIEELHHEHHTNKSKR